MDVPCLRRTWAPVPRWAHLPARPPKVPMFQLPEPAAVREALGRGRQGARWCQSGGSCYLAPTHRRPHSPQRSAQRGWGRRACCAPGACPSPRRQSTGRSQGRRCTCSGSPPPAHYNHHRSHWGVPCFGAPPEHTGGGDPSGTPSSLQGGWRAGDSVSHEESALGGRQSEGPQCHPSDTESTRIQLLN